MMVSKSTIYKQKRKVFTFSSVSSCLPLFPPTSSKIMLRCLKSSAIRYSKGTRRSNSSWFVWKKQWRPVVQSMQLRKQEKRQRPRQERKPKSKDLQKRRKKRKRQSISNNSRMRYQQRILLSQRIQKIPRLQKLNIRRLPQRTGRGNSLLRIPKGSSQKSTIEVPQLR